MFRRTSADGNDCWDECHNTCAVAGREEEVATGYGKVRHMGSAPRGTGCKTRARHNLAPYPNTYTWVIAYTHARAYTYSIGRLPITVCRTQASRPNKSQPRSKKRQVVRAARRAVRSRYLHSTAVPGTQRGPTIRSWRLEMPKEGPVACCRETQRHL